MARLEAWRCGSIYCSGHDRNGAAHEKDKNEKRESSDDELHWLPLVRRVPKSYTGNH